MVNFLYTGLRRQVCHANFNSHAKGELHPDRVMDTHDLVYILEGGWEVGQDGTNYVLEQGDVLILHAGHHHYGVNGYLPGAKTMFLHMNAHPGEKLAPGDAGPMADENMLALPVVIKARHSVPIISLFEDIIFTFWSDMPNKNIKLAALTDLLLFDLAAQDTQNTGGDSKIVDAALSLIRLTPDKLFTLSELSEELHICSRSLTDKFRKITGKSIHRYQMDLKLEMAYMLIKDHPGRPLKEVAVHFGFYDEFHLSRQFKKKYGFSPSGLKKNRK